MEALPFGGAFFLSLAHQVSARQTSLPLKMHPFTNRLAQETSPYLLQHAHNPVDWYPWGPEAFEKARKEDKPVLVSIGYAACHWCHVMERESFENPEVAAIMNEHFVNIKVDREERPDVDHIYMDAVQAMTGSGGWPLNVFLTPSKKPFYGGTYFPPRRAFNRASWLEVLAGVAEAYRERKQQVEDQAAQLTEHLKASNGFGVMGRSETPAEKSVEAAVEQILKLADKEWGGFGQAPKFPQTFTIGFLLRYSFYLDHDPALEQAILSLDSMIQGGIYDQVGGGFARYSTDREWLVPHFEKMLYDNALLVENLAEAYQLTGDGRYRRTLEETLAFVERELWHPEGGFYSALDADSEGVEGKFYVWSLAELKEVVGEDAEVLSRYYDISDEGNWEGVSIAWVKKNMDQLVQETGRSLQDLEGVLKRGKEKMLAYRSGRVRPQLDDKVILGWNALMNKAYSHAYAATGNAHYLEVAERNMDFLLKTFTGEDGMYRHTWKAGQARFPAFLDDYSNLAAALLMLGQVSGRNELLDRARAVCETVERHFSDEVQTFFYYTQEGQEDVLIRKKEQYDGATPSGNSVMAQNLYRLALLYDLPVWRERAEAMVGAMQGVVEKYPTSFGVWLSLLFELVTGTSEVALVGGEWAERLKQVLQNYFPHRLVQAAPEGVDAYPLLRGKGERGKTQIYLCRNYACLSPVSTALELKALVGGKEF